MTIVVFGFSIRILFCIPIAPILRELILCLGIMPSHVHIVIGNNKNELEDIVRDRKSFTSTALKKSINEIIQESGTELMFCDRPRC